MSLTELLLLIIVIAGAAYAGYLFGRQSVLAAAAGRSVPARGPRSRSPAPRETLDPPARRGTTAGFSRRRRRRNRQRPSQGHRPAGIGRRRYKPR